VVERTLQTTLAADADGIAVWVIGADLAAYAAGGRVIGGDADTSA